MAGPYPVAQASAAATPTPEPSAPLPAGPGGPALPAGRRPLAATACAALRQGRGVLLHGPRGMGKSALVDAVLGAPGEEWTVLRCTCAPNEAQLPMVALVDLFRLVPRAALTELPDGLGRVLRDALLRGTEPDAPRDRLALRLAVHETLRLLARARPVLMVLDGLQWMDSASADVLAFAVRRLAGTRVAVLATERVPATGQPQHTRCCPPDTLELVVGPLSDDDVADLFVDSGTAPLPPATLRAVSRLAGGNPLYARELANGMAAVAGTESEAPFPVPVRLRGMLLEGLRTLAPASRRTLLVCAAAQHPTLTLLRAAGLIDAAADLAEPERREALTVTPDGTILFSHPALPAALYAEADGPERREAHALLAAACPGAAERAHHLALAHPYADEGVATRLMAAAEAARHGGRLQDAARLAAFAAQRTPADRGLTAEARRLTAAEYACDAGRRPQAARLAGAVVASSPSPRQRAAARLVLLRNAGQALEGTGALIEEGLEDAAGDHGLTARFHHWAAQRSFLAGTPEDAARHARRAARGAALGGDVTTGVSALATLARVHSLTGRSAAAERALERALELAGGTCDDPCRRGLLRMRAVLALDCDRVAEARSRLDRLLPDESGTAGLEDRVATLVALTRVQVRAGECPQALRTADACLRVAAEAGVVSAPALYAAALAAAVGGTAEDTRRLAARAVAASETDGDRLFLSRALAAQAQAALLHGTVDGAAEAAETLHRVKLLAASMGAADVPLLHWYADLAEALVRLGETDAAAEVVGDARHLAHGRPPAGVLASLERAEGLREAALGHAREGADLLRGAAERLRPLGLPVDLARTLVALGAVERRARRRTAARRALGEALDIAGPRGLSPLVDRATAELGHLDALDGGGGPPVLTASEARIAELVSRGATNREVAAKLFISVKTVEGTLSRVYRKMGVRSRAALAHAMALPPDTAPAPRDAPGGPRSVLPT